MNLRENIKKILREETKISTGVLRRMKLGDAVNNMKKNALRHYEKGKSLNIAIGKGARFTASDAVPWHDEKGNDYDDETYNGWVKSVRDFLIENYGEETLKYMNKTIPTDVFNDDGNDYAFMKHSEPNGGSGFSEGYKTWGDLLMGKGWWFPLDWWEIKDKLDNMESGTVRILKPGDKYNNFGYYFSIRKIQR